VNSLIIASTRESAGKTSILIGLARAMGKRFGYVKPLGDRFLYRKKRLWDYDAALLTRLFSLGDEPETISIGFDHSKLRYMYDRETIGAEMRRLLGAVGEDRDAVFIECGKDLSYGASVWLDPLTLSQDLGVPVLVVASGAENEISDDLAFLKRFVGADEADVAGVIVNKVIHRDDFVETHLPEIEALGVNILGILPFDAELTTLSVGLLAEKLLARVIAGENGLGRAVRHVFVGAMSVSAALSEPLFRKPEKLIITSGDRSDMVLAALDAGGTSCLVLTHNIVPPSNVIAKASDAGVPILLVPGDTFSTAMQVSGLEPLLTAADAGKLGILERLAAEHVDLEAVASL